ncbi:DDB1- and CUL4-associated factor 4 [Sesamum indicum]|uniref:DDB1- and CUL4-associated factor 4 n=1 Tax=Sesamum indicum TaxID=4182 RepID=A0A6I9UQB2_SESIN|nr:DDB1- and CUL4-associated factor 4 [Sesamum indicum]
MPKDLPGFYYDAEKNRYFPYKGPVPGSSLRPLSIPSPSHPKQDDGLYQSIRIRQQELLQARELFGNVISSRKRKLSFRAEYEKRHASQPSIWKYRGTKKMANIALEHVVADITTRHGLEERDILLSGGVNGLLCLFQVGKTRQEVDPMQNYKVDHVWPLNVHQKPREKKLLRELGSSYGATTYMASDVSCIKVSRKSPLPANDAMSNYFLITTLGSDSAPGSVYLLDFTKPLDFDASVPIARDRFHEVAAFKQTLWTADCDPEGKHAAIGTNRGVVLLNMETRVSSWVLHSKSDVLSVQLDQSGTSIICGLRNGAIMTIDTRQRQIKRGGHSSSAVSMPSSICCLASLKLWDQYFVASSMDGSIKLYDHRLTQRGPVQSYEGNVNSHTRIEIGIDPSEKVVMSGGEDFYIRLWNIKSGELLFKDRFMNSIPSAVCWPRVGGLLELTKDGQDHRCYWQDHSFGAWLGSYEGVFYMDWL